MSTAPAPDPFEGDWTPELEEEIRAIYDGLPFELMDEDALEAQVAVFREYLEEQPEGEDPFA